MIQVGSNALRRGSLMVTSARFPMATYIYETIPKKKGQKPRRFEVVQKMSDAALTHDPKTGEPVRRVIVGGSGNIMRGTSILSMNNPRRGR